MRFKIASLITCAVLAVGTLSAFTSVGQKATCDSTTTQRCVIFNVGEGTGQLIVETTP